MGSHFLAASQYLSAADPVWMFYFIVKEVII